MLVFAFSEFWLEPPKFRFAAGEKVSVDVSEGENLVGEKWMPGNRHLLRAQLVSLNTTTELLADAKKAGEKSFSFVPPKAGTHLVAVESTLFKETLNADAAREYLTNQGQDDVLHKRQQSGAVSELVLNTQLSTKLAIQCGSVTDDAFSKRVGFRLELVLNKNPYSLKVGDHVQCLVLLDGKPQPHMLLRVWTRVKQMSFQQDMYTENDGTATFPIGYPGVWMVGAVLVVPSSHVGEWDNLKTSYIFGI